MDAKSNGILLELELIFEPYQFWYEYFYTRRLDIEVLLRNIGSSISISPQSTGM